MPITTTIDLTQLEGFSDLLKKAPKPLFKYLAKAYAEIGRYDIDRIRSNVSGSFNITSKGVANSFKTRATNPSQATDFSKLFTTEYTGWKAAEIFQTGGVIQAKNKALTILTPQARRASGKRQFTQSQIRNMIADKLAKFVPTPRGVLLVQFTKGGKIRKKAGAYVILAILKPRVTEQKRLTFYETAEGNESIHTEMLEYAIENTLADIAANEKGE
jgi:hypothetical protein